MKKNVLLSVIGVLLVLGIGVSFAYFVSQTLVTGDGASVTAEPGDMIKVTYDAGDGMINSDGMVPGSVASKDFSVTITPTEKEKEAIYSIILNITENTFVKCDDSNYNELTNACQKDVEELVYRLKDNDNQVIAEDSLIGATGEIKLVTETKTVDTQTTYNYTLEIEFLETGYDQNHNQNKVFNGSVTVEFSNKLLKDVILADNPTIDNSRSESITGPLTENTTGTLFTAEDDDGTSYFYAGDVDNNWVFFAGFYWRIIRINGDGSIRLIYQGTSANTTGSGTQLSDTSTFNTNYNNNMYVGFMYSSGSVHGTGTDSTIKDALDSWYTSNLAGYASKLDGNAGFCGDRASTTSSNGAPDDTGGTGTTETYYGARYRLYTNKTPSFKCSDSGDLYTTTGSSDGNKALTNPIGLITADEVAFAGGVNGSNNTSYYLYTGQNYWTMSPTYFDGRGWAGVFFVNSNGHLSWILVNSEYGVRPVINLKSDVTITSGDGTASNPYVI